MIKGHRVGIISELIAQEYFVKNGFNISKPINHYCQYDLVIEKENTLVRVQVKSIYWDNNKKRYVCNLTVNHRKGFNKNELKKYNKDCFDTLCAVSKETGAIYVIPIDKINNRRGITFYPIERPKYVSDKYPSFEEYKVQ